MRLVEMDMAVDDASKAGSRRVEALGARGGGPDIWTATIRPSAISTSARSPCGKRALVSSIR